MSSSSCPVAHDSKYPKIVPGGGLLLAWQLRGKKVLIVGGGPVAAGRLVNVKDADAHVTVICPSLGLGEEMRYRIFTSKEVDVYHDRMYRDASDVEGYDMVLGALDDIPTSRSICVACRERRIPVNIADVPPECDFYFGSLVRRGDLQIMVSTGGKGPKLANQVRMMVERALPQTIGPAIEKVGRLRVLLRQKAPEPKQGPKRMRYMIDLCERWNFDQLATLTEDDMQKILEGWNDGIAYTPTQTRGLLSAVPTPSSLYATLFGRCPVVGSISPWLSGLLGIAAGAAAASSIILAKQAR